MTQGLSEDPFAEPLDNEKEKRGYLSNLLGLIESGTPEMRRALRGFLLIGALDIVPDAEQHQRLTDTLAKAGWYLEGDTLIIGERRRSPIPQPSEAPAASAVVPLGATSPLADLHPLIADASEALWADGHYREAIGRAAIALLDAVRELSGLSQLDTDQLMSHAFRPQSPRIVVADLRTTNGQNLQRGTHLIAMGAIAAIRNPVSHSLTNHDPHRAREQLAVMSFLARRLDDARTAPLEWRG